MTLPLSDPPDRATLGPSTDHPVVRRLTALTSTQQREVACALSCLWDEFVNEMGGPAGWETRSRNEQAEYIRFLGVAAERIRLNGGADKEHYALAPELMGLYAHALRIAAPSDQDRAVAALALALTACGGAIRKAAPQPPAEAHRAPGVLSAFRAAPQT